MNVIKIEETKTIKHSKCPECFKDKVYKLFGVPIIRHTKHVIEEFTQDSSDMGSKL